LLMICGVLTRAFLEYRKDGPVTETDCIEGISGLAGIRRFARECRYEQPHADQVLKLSVLLFERLALLHGLGREDLFILMCAAVLHDIGWLDGKAGHHKAAMRMILDRPDLPLSEEQRVMTALTARYHRKALPQPEHAVYGQLTEPQQKRVRMLGGILRIADGLDCRHLSIVQDIEVTVNTATVEFCCRTQDEAAAEMETAKKKADLFELATGCSARFVSRLTAAAGNTEGREN
jgi:exopolyphosphatase/pppGpp-phosphohydrolase